MSFPNLKVAEPKAPTVTKRMAELVKAFPDTEFTLSDSGWLGGREVELGRFDQPVHAHINISDTNTKSDNPPAYETSPYYLASVDLRLTVRVTSAAEAMAAIAYLKVIMSQEFPQLEAIAAAFKAEQKTKAAEARALAAYAKGTT